MDKLRVPTADFMDFFGKIPINEETVKQFIEQFGLRYRRTVILGAKHVVKAQTQGQTTLLTEQEETKGEATLNIAFANAGAKAGVAQQLQQNTNLSQQKDSVEIYGGGPHASVEEWEQSCYEIGNMTLVGVVRYDYTYNLLSPEHRTQVKAIMGEFEKSLGIKIKMGIVKAKKKPVTDHGVDIVEETKKLEEA